MMCTEQVAELQFISYSTYLARHLSLTDMHVKEDEKAGKYLL